MTRDDAAALRREGLAFFGRMTAGQSHEVTNVLNIINELAGLQVDLLRAAASGGEADLARLAEISDRIQAQVARGETIIRTVNRFAHSVDLPVAVFDLGEVLERVVFLSQRTANLGRVELALRLPEESVTLENNPFCVQQAVFLCIDLAVAAATDRRVIAVGYHRDANEVEIEIRSADPITLDPSGRERVEFLRKLLTDLGGRVSSDPETDGGPGFALRLAARRGDRVEADTTGGDHAS